MRYRFKGIVRTTGQTVEGHAHGNSPEEAYQALSDHGIITESLREEPEALNLTGQSQPLSSAIDSALDTAASQVPFDKIADRYKGKSVWVIDRDKIRNRVSQVVDQALRDAMGDSGQFPAADASDIRKQVAEAIGGLFKDNRNLTSQASNTSTQLEHQIQRIESMVHRAESVLAQMTIAIGRIGSGGGGGGGGWGPRRYANQGGAGGGQQNAVLLEIFKENLRLRGIEIDEPKPAADAAAPAAPAAGAATDTTETANPRTGTSTASDASTNDFASEPTTVGVASDHPEQPGTEQDPKGDQ